VVLESTSVFGASVSVVLDLEKCNAYCSSIYRIYGQCDYGGAYDLCMRL
jgi:hypothetical protein